MEKLKQHFTKHPLNLIVFDLDGTLVDSIHDIYDALQACCQQYHIPPIPKDKIRQFVGPGAEELIQETIKNTELSLNDFYATFRNLYRRDFISQTHLFENLEPLLKKLHTHYRLAILTNKPEDASLYLLQNLGIDELFIKVVGPDTYQIAKPHPGGLLQLLKDCDCKKEEALFIGDTATDINCGKAANVKTVAITHGYGCTVSLEEAQADSIIDDMSDILSLCNKITNN